MEEVDFGGDGEKFGEEEHDDDEEENEISVKEVIEGGGGGDDDDYLLKIMTRFHINGYSHQPITIMHI